jgi:hypothetical protein
LNVLTPDHPRSLPPWLLVATALACSGHAPDTGKPAGASGQPGQGTDAGGNTAGGSGGSAGNGNGHGGAGARGGSAGNANGAENGGAGTRGGSAGNANGAENDGAGTGGIGTSGGSDEAGAGGAPTTYPPGPAGCGLEHAAFCETFDEPAGATTRAGELDPKRWSAARMCNIGGPSGNGEAVAIGPATVPACRSGLPSQILPSDDALVCDGNDQLQSKHLLVLVAAQNYGQNSYRIRQPFDFGGRTGKIVFDTQGYNTGLLGWVSLELSEDPTPAPSFTLQQNFENGAIPRNALEIQFSHNCGGDKVGIGELLTYTDFVQTRLLENEGNCADAASGKLNHFEIEISAGHVDVYATPASDDGVSFGNRVLLDGADIDLPFSRGYVSITTHNHATLKYSNDTLDAWAARWDNVGFDGPAVTDGWREYEALDSLSMADEGRVNVGWRVDDEANGPAQQIEIPGVDLQNVTGAKLALENWSLHAAGDPPEANFALNYRVNGKAWTKRSLTPSELAVMADLPNAGTRSLMLDVDTADLVSGTNTLEFTTSNAPLSYPPVVLNIDLILRTR